MSLSLVIGRQSLFCPVQFLLDYLNCRGNSPDPLFILGGLPVPRRYFCGLLAMAIKRCGLNPARYKGHSFRIGAASHAAERGMRWQGLRNVWRANSSFGKIEVQCLLALHKDSIPLLYFIAYFSGAQDWLARAAVFIVSAYFPSHRTD